MTFTSSEREALRASVKIRLSERRFRHTEGVADTACRIGSVLLPEQATELECAALLHDIAKEMNERELLDIARDSGILISKEDLNASAVLHSLIGPAIILRDFQNFATYNILSAVRNHTTGNKDMSIFDEIIFLSDYIEDGRDYKPCVETRRYFYETFSPCASYEDNVTALHRAAIKSLEYTEKSLSFRGLPVHSRSRLAKISLKSLI